MKLKFKKQAYQTNAVEAVANCFAGQHGYIRLHIYPSDSDFFRCFIGFGFLSES
jgi:restriction endonuclease